MAFKRTAIRLIIIVGITAVVAAAYLWYNFNAPSNLITIVPEKTNWFFHIQTRQIKNKVTGDKPKYLDSLENCISKLPIFAGVKDAGQVGLSLYSDVILFSNDYGWYLCLSVSSSNKLETFLKEPTPKKFVGNLIAGKECKFVKAVHRNIYFAFKNKACLFFVPRDTVENLTLTEKALAEVFAEKSHQPVSALPELKYLYGEDCDVVFYAFDENKKMSHGFNFDQFTAKRLWATKNINHSSTSPLWIFHKAGMSFTPSEVTKLLGSDNKITSNQYLNLCFKTAFNYLKPFTL